MKNKSLLPLLAAAILINFSCAQNPEALNQPHQQHAEKALIGGPVVTTKSHPWSESVFLILIASKQGVATCTGSLIGPSLLLTAGHCVTLVQGQKLILPSKDPNTGKLQLTDLPVIIIANNDKTKGTVAVEALLHPEYLDAGNGNVRADIALLKLAEPITVKNKLRIDRQGLGNYGGRGLAAGFGINEKSGGFLGIGAKESADYQLRTRKFQIAKASDTAIDGKADISRSFLIDNLRDANDAGGICQGDSGGPFLRGNKSQFVAGVISRSSGGCYSTAIATRVSDFKKWIEDSAKAWSLPLN